MAVAHVSTTAGDTAGTPASSLTFSHTVSAGSNLGLFVGVGIDGFSSETISGVTFNSDSLTEVGAAQVAADAAKLKLYRLAPPDVATANVVVSISAATGNIGAGATSCTGVDQTTPAGTFNSATGTSTSPSVAITGAVDDLILDCLCYNVFNAAAPTVGAGQTERYSREPEAQEVRVAGSTEAGAASVTMSWTLDAAWNWVIGGVAIKAAAATTAHQHHKIRRHPNFSKLVGKVG